MIPRRITCPRCFSLLRCVVRWRGREPVAIGYICASTSSCGYRAMGGVWVVAEA